MEQASNPNHQIRILLVDDEEIVHASIRRILTRAGYKMDAAFSAQKGIEYLKDQKFDLVIVDLMMPGMNGIQFLEAMEEHKLKVPVLMITGYPAIRTAVQALRLGAVDYIAKPFTRKELLGPVQRALSFEEEEDDSLPKIEDETLTMEELVPGSMVVLPRHAWAVYQQDGTFLVGVERSFLRICENTVSLQVPEEMELIEQGYIGMYLKNKNEEEHGVAMPLSGQVVEVNQDLLQNPSSLTEDTWLIRIIPSHLEDELGRLIKGIQRF